MEAPRPAIDARREETGRTTAVLMNPIALLKAREELAERTRVAHREKIERVLEAAAVVTEECVRAAKVTAFEFTIRVYGVLSRAEVKH